MNRVIYMIVRCVYALAFLIQISGVAAQDLKTNLFDNNVLIEMAHEHVTCAAFYAVGARCFAGDKDPTDRDHMQKSTIIAMMRSQKYLQKAGVNHNDDIASYRSQFDKMADEIHEDCQNLQYLIDQYGNKCGTIMNDPLMRLKQIKGQLDK